MISNTQFIKSVWYRVRVAGVNALYAIYGFIKKHLVCGGHSRHVLETVDIRTVHHV